MYGDENSFPSTSYDDNAILFNGSGGMTDTHPNRICINRDPKNPIDMVQRAMPMTPAAVPPESRTTTGRLHSGTRMSRMMNIKYASSRCHGAPSNDPECYERNPWGNGRFVDPRVAMHHARWELPWCWINPNVKLSLRRLGDDGVYRTPDRHVPWSHKTVPVALDPQCSHMLPFCWTTFDGTDILQYVYFNSDTNRWCPTFNTSRDMERAIYVRGIQRNGEESAEYETTFADTSDFTEIPHPIYQITTVSMANIFARRTIVDTDGKITLAVGKEGRLSERPIPHQGMRLEWFIPEFDNLSKFKENRQLEAWYRDKGEWKLVGHSIVRIVNSGGVTTVTIDKPEINPLDGTSHAYTDLTYGDPRDWRWRFTRAWLKRWNLAKHDSYNGEAHHELLIRPVEPNFADAITSSAMARIKKIVELIGEIGNSSNITDVGNVLEKFKTNLVQEYQQDIDYVITNTEKARVAVVTADAATLAAKTELKVVLTFILTNDNNVTNNTRTEYKTAKKTHDDAKIVSTEALGIFKTILRDNALRLMDQIYVDIQDEIQEKSRRIIGTISRLPPDTVGDESDWYVNFMNN